MWQCRQTAPHGPSASSRLTGAASLRPIASATPAPSASSIRWRLHVMPLGSVAARDCVRRVDIAGLDAAARQAVIAAEAQAAAGRLAPSDGAMLQAVWFDAGEAASGRLLLVIHHLAVDGVSWRILLPDLEAACRAAMRGESAALLPTGTSFRRWAQTLASEAQSAERLAELPLWTAQSREPVAHTHGRRARSQPRPHRQRPRTDADAAARGDRATADAGGGGVPCGRQRRAADRARAGGPRLGPAARPRP